MKKLSDKECKEIWEDTSAARPLKLDAKGLQVMEWVKRDSEKDNSGRVHDRKLGIN